MNDKPKVLLADDDEGVAAVVRRTLSPVCAVSSARDGEEALRRAADAPPDLLLLDVHMPGISGWDVLQRLRGASATRSVPVIMLTGLGADADKTAGFGLGADDYVTKPFSPVELKARVEGLLRRNRERLAIHPLTRLPGSPTIQAEAERRIREGRPFSLIHADLDRFKAFNDAYGFARGDQAILAVSRALETALRDCGETDGLLGHVGGDDFAIVCSEQCGPRASALACLLFDSLSSSLHDPADAARGWLEPPARRGGSERIPLLTLTVAGAYTRRRPLDSYAKAAGLAGEVKSWLKAREPGASVWAFDRRCDER